MNDARALLDAVRANPSDDAPRLAYAAWLDEKGTHERAEIIRLQCALGGLAENAPSRPAMEDRIHDLLSAHERRWVGTMPDGIRYVFERGFVVEIGGAATALVEHGAELFERHPISRLHVDRDDVYELGPIADLARAAWLARVVELDSEGFPELLASAHLRSVRRLTLQTCSGERDPEVSRSLAAFPSVVRLESLAAPGVLVPADLQAVYDALDSAQAPLTTLDLSRNELDADAVRVLGRAAFASRLTDLDLSANPLEGAGWEAVGELPCSLRRLVLSESARDLAGIGPLLARRALAELVHLELDARYVVDERNDADPSAEADLHAIGESAFWRRADALRLRFIRGAGGLEPLVGRSSSARLRLLDLRASDWHEGDASLLCRAAFAEALERLELMRTGFDDGDLETLCASGRFTGLRHLDVSGDPVTDAGARMLASTPSLGGLRTVDLSFSELSARGVAALLDGPDWNLSEIHVVGCKLGPELADLLAGAPALARLERLDLSFNEALGGDALLALVTSPFLSPRCRVELTGVPVSTEVRAALREWR